jgi:fused signal recognition particle receptor
MLEILGEPGRLNFQKGQLNIILLVGVNGTGKTTTAGKLCSRYKQQVFQNNYGSRRYFQSCCYRSVKVWGDRTDTPVISHDEGSDPAAVVFDAIKAAQARKADC